MKSRSLIALAVAGTLAWSGGALANSAHHSAEAQAPSSAGESAWLTGDSQSGSGTSQSMTWSTGDAQRGDASDASTVGMSSSMSDFGSAGYDSTMSSAGDMPDVGTAGYVEYWLLGEAAGSDEAAISIVSDAGSVGSDSASGVGTLDYALGDGESLGAGMTSSSGGSGSVAFDSTMSGTSDQYGSTYSFGEPLAIAYTPSAEAIADTLGEATPLLSEHYLVAGPLSSFDGSNVIVLEAGPAPEDVALLENLSRDFYVLTPIDPTSEG